MVFSSPLATCSGECATLCGDILPGHLLPRDGCYPATPAEFTARICLHYAEDMGRSACPALVCCGGQLELHGTPMERTWVKLKRQVEPEASNLALAQSKETRVNDIHNPLSQGLAEDSESEWESRRLRGMGGVSSFRDELPPVTVITSTVWRKGKARPESK